MRKLYKTIVLTPKESLDLHRRNKSELLADGQTMSTVDAHRHGSNNPSQIMNILETNQLDGQQTRPFTGCAGRTTATKKFNKASKGAQ